MACVDLSTPTLPTLPDPLSIDPPGLPGISTPGICCNLIPPVDLIPPLTLPPGTLSPAVIATINAGVQTVQNFIDHIVPDCPRNS